MWIIDRYLLRQYVQVFVICFASLTGLYIVFDCFSNLDEFTKAAGKEGSLISLLASFYTYRSVYFFDRTSGVLALIAAMFTVTWIQRHNELTALAAAGLSTSRIVRPVIVAALTISVAAALSRELVIPRISGPLGRDPKNLTGEAARDLQPRYDLETEILYRGQKTIAKDQKLTKPSLLLPPALDLHGKQLVAEDAFFRPADKNHPSGYLLKQVTQPEGLKKRTSVKLGPRTVVFFPGDAPWLAADECFVASNMDFEQLTGGSRSRQFSSTWGLIRGLRNPSLDYGADVRVTIHARIVQPLLDGTLLFLGLPLILARENRNIFLAIGMCMAVVTGFMLVNLSCQYLGAIYLLSPALAAWLPVMLFVPVATAMSEPLWR